MSEKEYKSPITVKEEEIDLVGIFKLIGNAFTKLFQFIEKILKLSLHYLIFLLIFLKEHILKFLIITILGASLGFILDYTSPQKYTYDMIIQPNYQSVSQIFENLEYYNVLIDKRDSITLSEKFNISYSDANSLSGFELITYETEKDRILAYDEFVKKTDSLTQKHFSYRTFKGEGASKLDANMYVYRITSYKGDLKTFSDVIISDVVKNPTLIKKKRIQMNVLKLDSVATVKALDDINSLRALYKDVTLMEFEKNKPASGTYIDFSKESKESNDIQLFSIAKELNENLIKIETKKIKSENIINLITTFNPSGKMIGTIYETNMFNFGKVFFMFAVFWILLIRLNRYLIYYKKSIK